METTKEHIFYVLECADGSFQPKLYVEFLNRVSVHNNGKGAKYTRARRPVTCIYKEAFETKQLAMKAEYAFKQLKKSEKKDYMANGMRGEQ